MVQVMPQLMLDHRHNAGAGLRSIRVIRLDNTPDGWQIEVTDFTKLPK